MGQNQKVSSTLQTYSEKFKKQAGYSNDWTKIRPIKEEASKLFDIAACKCEFQTCKCEKSKKVPQREQAFLADQRTKRVMAIGTVDIKVTTKIAKTMNRKNCSFKKEDPKPSCSYSDVPEKILEFSTY